MEPVLRTEALASDLVKKKTKDSSIPAYEQATEFYSSKQTSIPKCEIHAKKDQGYQSWHTFSGGLWNSAIRNLGPHHFVD
jgi:hypothetical protein